MWGGARAMVLLALGVTTLVATLPAPALAQYDEPEHYGGDLWSRPRLTGDWGGLRDQMAGRGVFLDLDLLQILQGVASGGRDNDAEYWGQADYTLIVDTGKLRLWPGGFLKVHALSSFGNSVNKDAGVLVPLTTASLLPAPGDPGTALMNLAYMQFLTTWFGLYVGKVETLEGDANAFAHNWRSDFMYSGLNFNLVNALVPLSAFGGGIVLLPFKGAIFTAGVLDPDGTPTDNDVGDAFEDGVLVLAEGRVAIKPFGRSGHQTLGFTWSNKDRLSMEQDPSNIARLLLEPRFPRLEDPGRLLRRILEQFFPSLLVPVEAPKEERDTWSIYYNFDQYLWHPNGDANRGVGVFFRFGVSDGKANPVKYAYNVGIGGKGVASGRPRDTFGIGWSRVEFSDDLVPFLRQQLHLGLDREDAIEAYYNLSVTPWLGVTVNLQVVDQSLNKTLESGPRLKDVDTAVIGGLRVYARF
jgi:porin